MSREDGTALVTGGGGFIGSHLVRALLTANFEVRILDNLSSGSKKSVPGRAEFLMGDS